MLKFIKIEEDSRVPKYKQIVDSVIHNIAIGNFSINDKIPSINAVSEAFYLSRDTVERAYGILKERKIINPIIGKGYYISTNKISVKVNILFIINKLSTYKMSMFQSFIEHIGPNCHTDFQVYHCDETLFLNLLEKYESVYDYYVITPHFKTEELKHISYTEKVMDALNKIPSNKLIIMDNMSLPVASEVSQIYQDFENDIYDALLEGIVKIKKYKRLILVYPEKSLYPYPRRILFGFKKFCVEHDSHFEIIDEVYEDIILKEGDLFITIVEADLVKLVKQIRDEEFVLGDKIGVISYNDTPLKELLGITVMSTDFKFLGRETASMIENNQKGIIKVPFHFIDRNSI
ncbi:GntR family transcriptional regulator [Flavobacterium sp. UMI-01]|uniref:GntR family transcriptional regulator n=1 Tax=Flavobacterium sp. UMI-01 TaxID=1441053 RepID=UPI001C7D5007|nr:GntR family transcriptional regulator [Flavobacterium sp. UMI-01]GIZ08135.1 transcriptional regulator [Flavobacterium sp. UMI-01]